MPYRRRRFKRTYRRGRGRYGRYRRKRSYARGRRAVKVYAMRQSARKYRFRKAIEKALQVERKYFRTSNIVSNDTTAETICSSSLVLVPRGSGPNDRTGRQISITSIIVAGYMGYGGYLLADIGGLNSVSSTINTWVPHADYSMELWVDTQPEAGAISDLNQLYDDTSFDPTDPIAAFDRDWETKY